MRRAVGFFVIAVSLLAESLSFAAEDREASEVSAAQVESWLARPAQSDEVADTLTPGPEEAPPPPPRRHGLTVESGIGALTYLGPLAHVSPTSPRFHLLIGYEPLRWLLAFAETDLTFSTTSYAAGPPPARTYRLYGFGGGVRFSLTFWERLGLFCEGSAGGARVSSDLLELYGYKHATAWRPYFGGRLGAEWLPVDPHLALGLSVGLRSYNEGLHRQRSSEATLAMLGGLSLRYTF